MSDIIRGLFLLLWGLICISSCSSTKCRCSPKHWQRVTRDMIDPIEEGVKVTYNQTANGLQINADVLKKGCGKPGSGSIFYVKGDWTLIRYTQEFYGSVSCWKIFGTTASPKYRTRTEFGFTFVKDVPKNDIKDFDARVGDAIFKEYRMNTFTSDKFDGHVYRCQHFDNENNFWHALNNKGMRSATVVLRRGGLGPSGITTETSCGTPRYVIKDVWVLM